MYLLSFLSFPHWQSIFAFDLPRKAPFTEEHDSSPILMECLLIARHWTGTDDIQGSQQAQSTGKTHKEQIIIHWVTKIYYQCSKEGPDLDRGLRNGFSLEVLFTLGSERRKRQLWLTRKCEHFEKRRHHMWRPYGEKAQLLWAAEGRLVELGYMSQPLLYAPQSPDHTPFKHFFLILLLTSSPTPKLS